MENVIQKVAELTGMEFEDLNKMERDTVMNWTKIVASREITVPGIKAFVISLKTAIENELATHKLSKKRDLFLKARLKNMIAMEGFIEGPEKAKQALELYLKTLQRK